MQRIDAYVRLAIIFVIVITILYLPILFYLKKKGKNVVRQLSYLGLICSLFLIIFATILYMPIEFPPKRYVLNLIPFNFNENIYGPYQFINEKIPNIMLFIPLGFFLPIVFKSKRKLHKTIIIAFFVTFGVEFIQYFIGRASDIDDVITNLLGGVIGYGIFKIANNFLKKQNWWLKLIGEDKNI